MLRSSSAIIFVSTHSRPKAAGGGKREVSRGLPFQHTAARRRLWTRPTKAWWRPRFQHTAARRRLLVSQNIQSSQQVSTHSRPKAAEPARIAPRQELAVSTHSRPKAAARGASSRAQRCCFNTQPPEGGWRVLHNHLMGELVVSTHSRPKAAVKEASDGEQRIVLFQHTAARRRLVVQSRISFSPGTVSTHSRPKAAGGTIAHIFQPRHGFNTQPPEGGWQAAFSIIPNSAVCFNTQPPEGGWPAPMKL